MPKDSISDQRDDILAFFGSPAGLITVGVFLVLFVGGIIAGSILGWW